LVDAHLIISFKPTDSVPWVFVLFYFCIPFFDVFESSMFTTPHIANFDGFWVHFIGTTYGAWLYGDERGFRTRHHREHIDGDYKNPPPPSEYLDKRVQSIQSLKQPVVEISPRSQSCIGMALQQKLSEKGAFVLSIAVANHHAHVLAKLIPDSDPRSLFGLAKKHAFFEVRKNGWEGKLWGRRGRELPIKNRQHQLTAYRYIMAHAAQGAWVWDWRSGQ
jgi:hypothetical protein